MTLDMRTNNYGALGDGLKLYTDAMRRFIKERLIATYPSRWWEDGVLKNLNDAQRNNVKRESERNPHKDRLEFIEAPHFVSIVSKEFDHAFAGIFGDYKKTQSFLQHVGAARNEHAHPRSGDFPADDVSHSLYSMAQLLAAAKLPEAGQVEQLRKEVLGIPAAPVETPAPASQPPSSPRPGDLPYWWQVCEPHDAFQDPNHIDESLFAATLGRVHAGSARDEYLDPKTFFAHTYFTENLKQTIADVASRMRGGEGPSVTEMQTPFGGGKTHALLTLYHLIKNPGESLAVPGVKEALGDIAIPPNARVLVFDGMESGTEPSEKEDGFSVSTLWGELAYQVDPRLFRREVMGSDANREAPGNEVFGKVLAAASPCLILIDELVGYLVKLKFGSPRSKNLYYQTVQFIQELLQLAGNVPGVCILLSLPQSKREFGGIDPQTLQRELGVLDELRPKADRVVSKRTPVNDDEIYTLVSKRMFKTVDTEAAGRAARAFRETYNRTAGIYDPVVLSGDYQANQVAAYPLHPELIDVLYKKWSTSSDFPRTRAVLQLLASVVADQWTRKPEAYSIQSGHVNLERERIRTKIVSAAGGSGYDAVVAADIIGGDAHADMLDHKRGGDYERHHIARGVATTLLMHSFGGQVRLGATPSELRLGIVAPNVGPEYVSEVLESLEQSLWFVHKEGEALRFQVRPNVYRIIAQTAEHLPEATVAERLRTALEGSQPGKKDSAAGEAPGFRILVWAGLPGPIADNPEPSIAILDPRLSISQEDGTRRAGEDPIKQLFEKVGGGLREWRNSLILVAADSELWGKANDAMREVMAYEEVVDKADKSSVELSENERKELRSKLSEKRDSLRTSITTSYRWVLHPDETGLTTVSLGVPAIASERIASRVVDRLSNQDYGHPKIMEKLGSIFFNSKLAPQVWKDEMSALDLEELSRRFRQWTYLPILPTRDVTLRDCIREGLGGGLWALVIGDNKTSKYTQLIEKPEGLDRLMALFDGSASLVKGELLQLIREELKRDDVRRHPDAHPEPPEDDGPTDDGGGQGPPPPGRGPGEIPQPRRLTSVRVHVQHLPVTKTSNLQPYLFKVLQDQDAGADLTIQISVSSDAGISEDALERRIVEGLEQLGINASWDSA
jgi:uncharacterized protein DUF499/HEPN superfamily Swt1-like protein